MTLRTRSAVLVAAALAAGGVGTLIAGATVAGAALLSLAGVVATSAAFYAVGLSEERHRRRHPRG